MLRSRHTAAAAAAERRVRLSDQCLYASDPLHLLTPWAEVPATGAATIMHFQSSVRAYTMCSAATVAVAVDADDDDDDDAGQPQIV